MIPTLSCWPRGAGVRGFATDWSRRTSPGPRGVGVRGPGDVSGPRFVAKPPHGSSAGERRRSSRAFRRESPARPLRGGEATFLPRVPSRIPRPAAPRGRGDVPPACSVANPPHKHSAGERRRTPRRGEPPHPAHPRILAACREEPRLTALQTRVDLRAQQRVSNWEDTFAAPGATLAPWGGEMPCRAVRKTNQSPCLPWSSR